MAPLDGKEVVKPTPFDAHEQIARAPHQEAAKEPGYAHSGLEAVEPSGDVVEFPKVVDTKQIEGAPEGHTDPVLVNSAEEEQDYLDAKVAEAHEEEADEAAAK